MPFRAITGPMRTVLRSKAAPLLFLLVLTGITYREVLNHTFLINWDDQAYITRNPAIRGFSLDYIKTAFTVVPFSMLSVLVTYLRLLCVGLIPAT